VDHAGAGVTESRVTFDVDGEAFRQEVAQTFVG
jgi:hypothetical protein